VQSREKRHDWVVRPQKGRGMEGKAGSSGREASSKSKPAAAMGGALSQRPKKSSFAMSLGPNPTLKGVAIH
jgi:hypothetical protein